MISYRVSFAPSPPPPTHTRVHLFPPCLVKTQWFINLTGIGNLFSLPSQHYIYYSKNRRRFIVFMFYIVVLFLGGVCC